MVRTRNQGAMLSCRWQCESVRAVFNFLDFQLTRIRNSLSIDPHSQQRSIHIHVKVEGFNAPLM